jgi:hypothetical protein
MKQCHIIIALLFISLSAAQGQPFDNTINEHSDAVASDLEFSGINGTLWDGAVALGMGGRGYLGLRDGIWYAGNDDYGWLIGGRYAGDDKVFMYSIDPEYYLKFGVGATSICFIYEDANGYHFHEVGVGVLNYIVPVLSNATMDLKEVNWYPPMYDRFKYAEPKDMEKSLSGYVEIEGLPSVLLPR